MRTTCAYTPYFNRLFNPVHTTSIANVLSTRVDTVAQKGFHLARQGLGFFIFFCAKSIATAWRLFDKCKLDVLANLLCYSGKPGSRVVEKLFA